MTGKGGLSYLLYVCKQVKEVRVCWVSDKSKFMRLQQFDGADLCQISTQDKLAKKKRRLEYQL